METDDLIAEADHQLFRVRETVEMGGGPSEICGALDGLDVALDILKAALALSQQETERLKQELTTLRAYGGDELATWEVERQRATHAEAVHVALVEKVRYLSDCTDERIRTCFVCRDKGSYCQECLGLISVRAALRRITNEESALLASEGPRPQETT